MARDDITICEGCGEEVRNLPEGDLCYRCNPDDQPQYGTPDYMY